MEPAQRRTVIAHGRLAMRELRLSAARTRRHGLQVMTWEQLAARLAGGLAQPVDDETLREAIYRVLPDTPLGELDGIKGLPGFIGAAADTLRKAWRADVNLQKRAAEHPRLQSMAALEKAVLELLPPSMMRPADLVTTALDRVGHAPILFGPVDIVGITELSPCWRPILRFAGLQDRGRFRRGSTALPSKRSGRRVILLRLPQSAPPLPCTRPLKPFAGCAN